MKRSIIFVCSGQGTQYFQMGRALYETEPRFRHHLDYLNEIYRELTSRSLLAELYGMGMPSDPCDDLRLSHPAIVMIEYALAQTLIADGIVPDYTLGYSLGAFAAAAISGMISAEEALTLAIHQAQAIQSHCQPGAMWALLADRSIYVQSLLCNYAVIAAENFNGNFVISAPELHRPTIQNLIKANSISAQLLPIRFAFHSAWLDDAKETFIQQMMHYLNPSGRAAHIPLWCCASQVPLNNVALEYFWSVVRRPVNFIRTVQQLEQQQGPMLYLDVGPSGSMATILKYLLPTSSTSMVMPILSLLGDDNKNLASVRKVVHSV